MLTRTTGCLIYVRSAALAVNTQCNTMWCDAKQSMHALLLTAPGRATTNTFNCTTVSPQLRQKGHAVAAANVPFAVAAKLHHYGSTTALAVAVLEG